MIRHGLSDVVDHLLIDHLFVTDRMFELEVLSLPLHLLDKIFTADLLQMPDTTVFVAVLRAVLRINVLPGIYLHLELMVATLEGAVHDHRHHFSIAMLECLVLDVDVFWFGPLPDAIPVLTVFRAIFRDMNPEKYFSAARIETPFFPELLTSP